MARDAVIEGRLLRWAAACTIGDGSGYPTINVLSSDWMPPSGGITPTMKVAAASDVTETHAAIGQLSVKLRWTLVVHYCKRGTLDRQCEELGCERNTLYARIDEAHRQLVVAFKGGFLRHQQSRIDSGSLGETQP